MRYIKFIPIVFAVMFLCCCDDDDKNHINALLIHHTFLERDHDGEIYPVFTFEQTKPYDTLFTNMPYDFKSFNLFLNKQFDSIDTINTNKATRDYIKALFLADAIHRLFSFQFMGNHGYSPTPIAYPEWNEISDEQKFTVGNNNQQSIWCGDRTNFYLSLLKKTTGINGYSVSLPDIHTYAVLKIGNKHYIVDAYDPFIVMNKKNEVVDYATMIANKYNNKNNIEVIRTKRLFGYPNYLLSERFLHIINSQTGINKSVDQRLLSFLTKHKNTLLKNVDSCSYENIGGKGILRTTKSSINPYAIEIKRDKTFSTMLFSRFNKYYLGISCNANIDN